MAPRRQEDPLRLPSSPLMPEFTHNLASSLYHESYRLAAGKIRFERGNHTLRTTAFVNDSYFRLGGGSMRDRSPILGRVANVMRHTLVDHTRAGKVGKWGDAQVQSTLIEDMAPVTDYSTADMLTVNEALNRPSEFDPRRAKIREMHFFAGLTFEEIILRLSLSTRTVKRGLDNVPSVAGSHRPNPI